VTIHRPLVLISSNPVFGTGGASRILANYYQFFDRLSSIDSLPFTAIHKLYIHNCSYSIKFLRYLPSIALVRVPWILRHFLGKRHRSIKPVVWWHSFGITDALLLLLFSILIKPFGCHLIVTLHCPTFFDYPTRLMSKIYFFCTLASCTAVHVLNNHSENVLLMFKSSYGFINRLVVNCVNPLSSNSIIQLRNKLFSKHSPAKIANATQYILSMCQLVPGKRIDHVIDALEHLPINWSLLVAGDGIERSYLEKLVDNKNLRSRVIFLGFLSDIKKAKYFSLASVFCVPSCSDTQSIVNVEAISHGLPIALYPYQPLLSIYNDCPSVIFSARCTPVSLSSAIILAANSSLGALNASSSSILSRFDDKSLWNSFFFLH